MSVIVDGEVIDSEVSKEAKGGTELMRSRLLRYVDANVLDGAAIHFSRVRCFYPGHKNIYYAHDMAHDTESEVCKKHQIFDAFVFVSYWQRDQFLARYDIPFNKCHVIENATEYNFCQKDAGGIGTTVRLVYHTTPHRGLQLLPAIFRRLKYEFRNSVELDVFSSFNIYGQQDPQNVLDIISELEFLGAKSHGFVTNENMNYHLRKSANVFIYPSIWPETSCLAMIESMKADCYVVHPSFGALTETGMNIAQSKMFRMSNVEEEIVDNCTEKSSRLIRGMLNGNIPWSAKVPTPIKYDIETFKSSWEKLLRSIKNE